MGARLYAAANRHNGVVTTVERDNVTGVPIITMRQKTDAIVAANRALANAFESHHRRRPSMVKIASIPVVVWQRLVRHGIAQDDVAFRKWLNRRDARAFRTDDGRRL